MVSRGLVYSMLNVLRFTIVTILLLGQIIAQTFEISGKVLNESGKKLGNARLTLYSMKHQLVSTVTSRSNGKFKFKKIRPDKYTLNIYGEGGFTSTQEIDLRSASAKNMEISTSQDEKQPQLTVKSEIESVVLSWKPVTGGVEYVVFKDNQELTTVKKPTYKDKVVAGKSYAYNVTAIDKSSEKSTRSLTEYGKALFPPPKNIKAKGSKNTINLTWGSVENASAYNIYRDDDLVNTTTETSYSDFKLKYDEDYTYVLVTIDHHQEEGSKSNPIPGKTHKEVKKIKKIKAEAGESIVDLDWSQHDLAVKYRIYQNGTLIDSSKSNKYTAKTDPGSENCFTVTAVDKYGTEGPQSVPACDKAQYPPPEKITLTLGEPYSDEMNSITLEWTKVDGATSYNIYRNGKELTNSRNNNYKDGDLDFAKQYTYEISSLSDDGLEGPISEPAKENTPNIFKLNGQLINEKGQPKIEEAKVFLYTKDNVLWEEFTAGSNGKFTFENRIITGEYTIKAFGDGHGNNGEYAGNGGKTVSVKNKDVSVKINLSTNGLRPEMRAKRGVQKVLIVWKSLPHAESYTVYKNDKAIAEKIRKTKYVDSVAPGKKYEYYVRAWDLYDLEGPESNMQKEKSSYQYPTLKPNIKMGALKTEGSGRIVTLDWIAIPEVEKYALYRDGERLSIQPELVYVDSLEWGTEYKYAINSLDTDGDEGAMSEETIVNTHPEVLIPDLVAQGGVNAVQLTWTDLAPVAKYYKVFRNGNYLGDFDKPSFADNVAPGKEYCYSVSAADEYETEGEQSSTHCAKGQFAAPNNFASEIMRNTINFSWNSVEGVSGYHLYRNDSLILTTKEFSYFDEALDHDKEYKYDLASFDQDGDDGPMVSLSLRTHEEVTAPTMSGAADLEKITITWNQLPLRIDHIYRVYRDGVLLSDLTDTFYVDIVDPGKFYCYKISAKDSYGTEGPFSNEECFKVLVNYPRDLTLTGDVKRVVFRWKKMLGAVEYRIYEHNKENGETKFMTKTTSIYYIHKGLEFDTEYCYKMSSVDADGDEGPLAPVTCGWVLPPPHLTLVEKYFVEQSDNQILDGNEKGYIIAKIVNDGRSPARVLKPWLESIDHAITPSLVVDTIATIPILGVGDSTTITFPLFAKLKIETGERNFNIRVDEYAGTDLKPEPISFQTLAVIPPDLVISDFAIDNEFGHHYIPKNETATLTVRFQNLSIGKTDTAVLEFRRGEMYKNDPDEVHTFGLLPGGKWFDYSFEIMSKEDRFTVYFDTYDYFGVRKTIPIHLDLLKYYKGKDELLAFDVPLPDFVQPGQAEVDNELVINIPSGKTSREMIGIILGNRNFWTESIPGRSSSEQNVKVVRRYFNEFFGMGDHQMIPSQFWFFEDGITSQNFREIFNPHLGFVREKIESGVGYSNVDSVDLMLYYSGEGTTIAGEKCLIPFDADKDKLHSFFKIKDLYSMLSELQKIDHIRDIFVFMDVDFNNSAFEQNIVRPEPVVVEEKSKKKKKKKKKKKEEPVAPPKEIIAEELIPPKGITAFFAANTTEISYDHPDMDNGLFTYFLLKGFRGEADNGDKAVTVSELHNYIKKNVHDTTKSLYADLPQTPQLFTHKPDRVLFRLP